MAALGHARAGARRDTALLALPGARRPVIASAVGSTPIGMLGVAILLPAQDATGALVAAALGGAIVEGWSYEAGALVAGAISMLGAAVAVARRRTLA